MSETTPDDVAGILAGLTSTAGLPRAALAAAAARWEELRPALHAVVRHCTEDADPSDLAIDQAFFAVYLMAQQRDTAGFAVVCALARHREAADAVMGDGLTENLSSILVRLFDGDAGPLRALIEAADADEFARAEAFEALAWLTAAGRIDREETARYLADLFQTLQPQGQSFAWVGWQQAIADLGLAELARPVRKVFSRGWIDRFTMSLSDFEGDLKLGCAAKEKMEAFSGRCRSLAELDDIAEMFSHWAGVQPANEAPKPAPPRPLPVAPPPLVSKTARNAPCPCGSGKKFKKCCLGKAA